MHVRVFRTDVVGTVTVVAYRTGYKVQCYNFKYGIKPAVNQH